jgi:ubiquitin carboxyl-terminal hydrolase 8
MKQLEKMAARSWEEYLKRNRSVIVDLFQGQLKSSVRCLSCNHRSVKFDIFMFLSLPIPETADRRPTLHECLEEFTKEERLGFDELWTCPRCKKQVEATKKFDIWKVPPILIVHLKRFSFTSDTEGDKIDTFIDYPVAGLDLENFTAGVQKD